MNTFCARDQINEKKKGIFLHLVPDFTDTRLQWDYRQIKNTSCTNTAACEPELDQIKSKTTKFQIS